jgi:hypothetical protein
MTTVNRFRLMRPPEILPRKIRVRPKEGAADETVTKWHHLGDDLQMEGKVRRDGRLGGQAAEDAGG